MYNLCVIIRGIGFVPGDAIYFWLGENETFFSTNRKSALDMIRHQDKHWKSSTRSTLEGFKLGLVIFDDTDEFSA